MGEEIKSMKFELSACEVNIRTAEGSGLISVEYAGSDKLKPEITCENGKFVATQKGSGFSFGIHSTTGPKLDIVVGTDVDLDTLEMDIDAGNIKLTGIKADYFYGDIDAGNIEIKKCDLRKVEFDVDAGNFDIDDSSIKIMNLSTDAGNIEVDGTTFEDIYDIQNHTLASGWNIVPFDNDSAFSIHTDITFEHFRESFKHSLCDSLMLVGSYWSEFSKTSFCLIT